MRQAKVVQVSGHVARRRCVGCGQQQKQNALIRISCKDGREPISVDSSQAPGRGAYLCHRISCAQRALQKRAIERALRIKGSLPMEIVRLIKEKCDGAGTMN
ncbi:MAG: YlxR family protein [Abditibacteriaceae bacterium]